MWALLILAWSLYCSGMVVRDTILSMALTGMIDTVAVSATSMDIDIIVTCVCVCIGT